MEKKQFTPSTLAYIRVTGPYGENYEPAIAKLCQWEAKAGLEGSTCIFIYHDNPESTPAEKCRTDLCLMVPEGVTASGEIELQPFAGGEYATLRKTITEKPQYGAAWNEHITQIVQLGIEMDDRPCFELYHSYDQATDVADVSFCSAIK